MHESSLIAGVISTLLREAKKHNAGRIGRVYLCLGKGPHNLEPDRVKEVFTLLARGTITEGAALEINQSDEEQTHEIIIEKFEAEKELPDDSSVDY